MMKTVNSKQYLSQLKAAAQFEQMIIAKAVELGASRMIHDEIIFEGTPEEANAKATELTRFAKMITFGARYGGPVKI